MVNYTTVEQILSDNDFMFALVELRDIDEVVNFCKENELEVDVDLLLKVRELFTSGCNNKNNDESLTLTSLDEVAGGAPETDKQRMSVVDSLALNAAFVAHGVEAGKIQETNMTMNRMVSFKLPRVAGACPMLRG